MQAKHGDEVAASVSQTMDLLEVGDKQSLANSFHEFLKYQKCLQWFNEAKNEHKDNLRQQRFSFVVKRLKEFDMANARKIEVIKWDWNLLWHIINNDQCLPMTERPELPWLHSSKEAKIIACNLLQRKTPFKNVPWEVWLVKVFFYSICLIRMLIVHAHSKVLTWHPLERRGKWNIIVLGKKLSIY